MPAKNHLSEEQKEQLLKTLKEHDNPYVREKILILLSMNDGKTYQEISDFLDISYPTVAYWAVHGDPDKLESFLDGRREGNFRKITKEYEDLLLEVRCVINFSPNAPKIIDGALRCATTHPTKQVIQSLVCTR